MRRAISKMAMCIQRKGGCGHPAALRQPGEGVRTAGGTEEKKLVFALASIANHRRQISGKPLFNGSGFAPVSDMAPRNQPSRNPEIRAGAWLLDTILWFSQAKPAYGKLIWPRKVSERRARCRPRTQAEKLHGRRHRAARRYFAPLSIASCPRRDCAKRYFQPLEFALFFDAVCPRGAAHGHRRAGHGPQSLSGLLLLHKSTLDHVVARLGGVALFVAALF